MDLSAGSGLRRGSELFLDDVLRGKSSDDMMRFASVGVLGSGRLNMLEERGSRILFFCDGLIRIS